MRVSTLSIGFAALVLASRAASALVVETLKAEFAVQTANGPGGSLADAGWRFDGRVIRSSPTDFDSVTLTIPQPPGDGSELPMVQQVAPNTDKFVYSSPGVGNLTQLDAAFPEGDYTFTYTGGALDGSQDVLTQPGAPSYPSVRPVFLGNTYSDLQSFTSGQSINVAWGGFTFTGVAATTFVQVFRTTDGAELYGVAFEGSAAGADVVNPSDLLSPLLPGDTYSLVLSYTVFASAEGPINSSGGSFDSRFERRTFIPFQVVVPEPGGLAILVSAGVLVGRRRH